MQNEPQKSLTTSSKAVSIAPSKIFTYPTRLANCWRAEVMEINLPGFKLEGNEIEVKIREGSTSSLGIQPQRIYRKIYKKIAPPINMKDHYIHDARYDTDRNIAHILGTVLPRILIAKEICPNITVVLKKKACTMAKNVYNLFGFSVFCTDRDVQGKLILVNTTNPSKVNPIEEFIGFPDLLFNNFSEFSQGTPERVFISRKGTRGLINEQEIEQTLYEYGFHKFYFEDIPLSQQWSIMRNAKVIVGVHGAGLAGIIFNRNTPKVIELVHPGYLGWGYRPKTNAVGGKWCGVTGQITPNVIRELDFKPTTGRRFGLSSMKIHSTSLKMALEYLQIKSVSGKLN